mmetsp:Transcript_19306/g.27158  ORF Transcript_19306/g.27158 Transcript_19306/m.27158 type:complete len:113 (+) Transcript_19306:165-503(+)
MSSRILSPLGAIILLHSAYSCLHYRSILSSSTVDLPSDLYSSSPPQDVVVECIAGFVLCLLGQLSQAGSLQVIRGEGRIEMQAPSFKTRDFDIFNTRAKVISTAKQSRTNAE